MDIFLDTEFTSPNLPIDPLPGYFDDFERAAGPVGYTSAERRPWASKSSPAGSSPLPLVVDAGAARRGAGGSATYTIWAPDAGTANGVLTARVRNLGDASGALIVRAADAENFILLSCRRDKDTRQYSLQKRVNGTPSTLASSGSVESVSGDLVQVICDGPNISVRINGATIFGGPRVVNDFLTRTSHGVIVYGVSSGAESWDSMHFAAVS